MGFSNRLYWKVIGFIFFLVACQEGKPYSDKETLISDRLKSYSTFSDVASDLNTNELKRMFEGSALDSAEIVGCGQSSYGSHENFELQSLVFKHLVLDKGCRIFLIEAPYPGVLNVNRYVSSGIGTEYDVLKSLGYWIWSTGEMWQLIEWIRAFNRTRNSDDKILFLGNDMQGVAGAAKGVQSFFNDFIPGKAKSVDRLLKPFLDSTLIIDPNNQLTKELYKNNIEKIRQLLIDPKQPTDSNKVEEFTLSMRTIDLLEQSIFFSYNQFSRDSLMAANVKWVVDQSFREGPAIIWAQNGHIETMCDNDNVRMGCYLKNYYGSKYYNLGIDFTAGEFNLKSFAIRVGDSTVIVPQEPYLFPENASGSLIERFAKMDHQLIFFRVNESKKDSLFKTFDLYEFGSLHQIGTVYDSLESQKEPEITFEYTLPYDGVLIFKLSTPTKLLTIR